MQYIWSIPSECLSCCTPQVDGDGGSLAAESALMEQILSGIGQRTDEMIEGAPPGPIETKWGLGYRSFGECMEHIKAENDLTPEGALRIPLRYSVFEEPSYAVVPSYRVWSDKSREAEQHAFRENEVGNGRRALYYPQMIRDARRITEQLHPRLNPNTAECMDKLGIAVVEQHSACDNFYDHEQVQRVFYPEIEKLLLDFFPGATDVLVYNHDAFDKSNPRQEDQDNKDPGVNGTYANLVHNDLNDNSGRVRVRELLTKNLKNFGRQISPQLTDAEVDAKLSKRFMSINLAKPMETVEQNPFVLCAWPSFADQPYITNYRLYNDRVGETTRFTYRKEHEWYWLPRQQKHEISMLKCYDSVTDGSVSRWSFHTAAIDPTVPRGAPCRKNVVVRSFVFF